MWWLWLAAALAKDSDQDRIKDELDKCPSVAEDVDAFQDEDGCPDLDDDHDGIVDMSDRCPREPEDLDGVEDDDGCPEARGAAAEEPSNAIRLYPGPCTKQRRLSLEAVTFADQDVVLTWGSDGRPAEARVTTHLDEKKRIEVEKFVYDPAGRLAGSETRDVTTGEVTSTRALVWDAAGRVLEDRYTGLPAEPRARALRFEYDSAGRVAREWHDDDLWSHTYDASGLRIGTTRGEYSTRYAYDAAGRLVLREDVWSVAGRRETRLAYDALGNLLAEHQQLWWKTLDTGAPNEQRHVLYDYACWAGG